MMKNVARPLPRSSAGNALSTRTVADGISSAPPAPCSTRKVISHGSAHSPLSGTSPHISDAAANRTMPIVTMRRWPMMSPRRPPSATNAAVASA